MIILDLQLFIACLAVLAFVFFGLGYLARSVEKDWDFMDDEPNETGVTGR